MENNSDTNQTLCQKVINDSSDWLVSCSGLFDIASFQTLPQQKQTESYQTAFLKLCEIVTAADIAKQEIELDIIGLVMEFYEQVKSTVNVEPFYVKFREYLQWLKAGKPSSNRSLNEFYVLHYLNLIEQHIDTTQQKTFYFDQIQHIRSTLKQPPFSDNDNNNNRLWLWMHGLLLFLHARGIRIDSEWNKKAACSMLNKAQEKMQQVISMKEGDSLHNHNGGGSESGSSRGEEIGVVDRTVFLGRCCYYMARVKALLEDNSECIYYLTKAKVNNELPSIETVKKNKDFSALSSKFIFNEILSETLQFSSERNSFNEDRKKSQDLIGSSHPLAQSVTASQMLRNVLTTSTLDFLVQQKLPGVLNFHDFFQPVINFAHKEAEARLKERMKLYGLCAKREIPGDGNCQMHSLSDQLCGNLKHAKFIRRTLVSWLRNNAETELSNGCTLKDFVHDQSWDEYCKKMSKEGEWGDHLTLIAASEIFNVSITILSSIPGDNYVIEVVPVRSVPVTSITLSHFAEFHYGSIHPV